MTGLEFLISLRPAIPMSVEHPCTETSNSELRRWMRDNAVGCNGKPLKATDEVLFPVTSLVLFPKSAKRRCTLF